MGDYPRIIPREDYHYERRMPTLFQSAGAALGTLFYFPLGMRLPKYTVLTLPVFAGTGMAIGHAVDTLFKWRMRQHMVTAEDYIDRHPEDFKEPPAKRVKDVVIPWVPVR